MNIGKKALKAPSAPRAIEMPNIFTNRFGIVSEIIIPMAIKPIPTKSNGFLPYLSDKKRSTKQIIVLRTSIRVLEKSLRSAFSQ